MTGIRTAGMIKALQGLAHRLTHRVASGGLLLSLAAPAFLAQSQVLAQSKVEREVDFALALAKDLGLISLAQSQIEQLQAQSRGAGDQDAIAQAGITITFFGARISPDRNQQRLRFKETVDKSKELIERSSSPQVQSKSRTTLAEACEAYGQFLTDEIAIAQAEDPEQVKELENEAGAVFKTGIEACDKLMTELADAARKDRSRNGPKYWERGFIWLRKGILLRELGRAIKAERGYQVDRAKRELEDLVFEYGEETALGLKGLFEMAQCQELLEQQKRAISAYQGTINQISRSLDDTEGTLNLSADTQALLFNMQQEVYSHLAHLLFQQGDTAACQQLIAQFEENLGKFGEKGLDPLKVADPRYGHLTFLVKCRLLAESGDAQKVKDALALAQKINDFEGHDNDLVGVQAKAVIRDILASQQSLVSGKLLFEIAKGSYQNKEYGKAVQELRSAVAAMSKAELEQYGPEAYQLMGLSFAFAERYLEATIAFQTGLQRVGKAGSEGTQKLAELLEKATNQLNGITKKDAGFEKLTSESQRLVQQFGSEAQGDPRHWAKGEESLRAAQNSRDPAERKRRATEAIAAYKSVSPEFLRYEEARVRVAVAQAMAGDYAGAQQTIDEYRRWLQTKEATLDPSFTPKLQVRQFAQAEADFREAVLQYDIATGAEDSGAKKDLTKYPAAIDKLNAFLSNHQKDANDSLIGFALDRLGRLYSARGDLEKAEEAYARLKAKDPQGTAAAALATVIFDDYRQVVENLEQERDKALNDNKPGAEVAAIQTQLESARRKLVSLGAEYMRGSTQPQVGIMVITMRQYQALPDWNKVAEIAQKIIDLYKDSKDEATLRQVNEVALPMLGEALLEQGQFQRAATMLEAAEKANPQVYDIKRLLARALGGWFNVTKLGAPEPQPALGKPIEAYQKYWGEYRLWGLRPEVKEYSLEWYRFYWEAYWFALQASRKDSSYAAIARKCFVKAKSIDNFATLHKLGEAGQKLERFFLMNQAVK